MDKSIFALYVGVDGQIVTIVTDPAGIPVDGQPDTFDYRISSINTAPSISTAVWYYSNTNNIEFNVYFNSNAPSNNTA